MCIMFLHYILDTLTNKYAKQNVFKKFNILKRDLVYKNDTNKKKNILLFKSKH